MPHSHQTRNTSPLDCGINSGTKASVMVYISTIAEHINSVSCWCILLILFSSKTSSIANWSDVPIKTSLMWCVITSMYSASAFWLTHILLCENMLFKKEISVVKVQKILVLQNVVHSFLWLSAILYNLMKQYLLSQSIPSHLLSPNKKTDTAKYWKYCLSLLWQCTRSLSHVWFFGL